MGMGFFRWIGFLGKLFLSGVYGNPRSRNPAYATMPLDTSADADGSVSPTCI